MIDDSMIPTVCLVCHEPAVEVRYEHDAFFVECLDCGGYEILEIAARHIEELSMDDRRHVLAKAASVAEVQGGPPLIREPF